MAVRMKAPERRRQLLEVAADLFARRGYRGATTAEIARAAGITEPILYRHFENKLDLFVTLIHEVGNEVIARWKDALEGVKDPRQRLEVILGGNPATHERGRGIYRIIFQAMTELESDPRIDSAIRRHVTRLQRFLRIELKSLQKTGLVRTDESADRLALLLIDVAIGHGMLWPLGIANHATPTGRAEVQELLEELLVVR